MKYRYLPLFAAATALAAGGGASADIAPAPETPDADPAPAEPADEPSEEPSPAAPDEKPAEEEAAPEETPEPPAAPEAAPEAAAVQTPPKLNAFQRGALRALSLGELVARVETAEGERAVAQAEAARLTAENQRLATELAAARNETAEQVAAAEEVGADKLQKGVTAELSALGIEAKDAPGAIGPEAAEKTLPFEEFQALSHEERNKFMASGGKIAR